MDFAHALMIDQYTRTGNKNEYKASLDTMTIFNINQPIPAIQQGSGCIGIAIPYEYHVSAYGTIVFFKMIHRSAANKNMLDELYRFFIMQGQNAGLTEPHMRTDRDTQRTGMDAATRMMTGMNRDPRDIARGRKVDDRDSSSIWDMMKQANPGDDFFED